MHRHTVRDKILQYSVANNVNDIWFARSFMLLFFFDLLTNELVLRLWWEFFTEMETSAISRARR